MNCQSAVFLTLTFGFMANCGVITRRNEEPAKLKADQEIRNVTDFSHIVKSYTTTDDEELQESGDKRLRVPEASSEKATIKQEMKGIAKSNQTENNNVKNAAVAVQPQDPSVAPLDVVDEDITKASQEVAEISRLIGKPLTDSHALAMLKGILLEKIHAKLEDTKDISASSKSTEEGVNKFVAALAASKKKNDEQAKDKDESQTDNHQKSDTHKQPEPKEKPSCNDKEPTARCEYLKSMGLCNDKGHGEVKVRCQLTCGACPDCSGCTTIDCGTICIGYDVQAAPPAPAPVPAPAPAPVPVPAPVPAPVPIPAPVPVPAPAPPPAPVPPPHPIITVVPPPAAVLPVTTPHPHAELAHVPALHEHDAAGHAVVTTNAPLAHVHPTVAVALPTTVHHLVEPVTATPVVPPPPCKPIVPTVPHTVPPPVDAPPAVVASPPCKPVTPTCPPCKPESPTCQPCEPIVPVCPPPKPKPVAVVHAPSKAPPCVPVEPAHPVAVHPTAQAAETWHHHLHHHHAHAVGTATVEPIVKTTPVPHIVANPTTPVVHIDVNAAFPVEAKPAVAPVVVNPAHKPAPTVAPAPVEVAAPAPVAVAAPAPVTVVAPTSVAVAGPAPVAVAAPAAEVQRCANPVDIGLALDSSAGVRGRWSYMKNFALSMIDHFQMGDHARFGVVQFDTIAKFPIRLETYNDAEMLKVHIHKLMMNPFGKRRTDEALKIARDDLFRTARAGVRRAMVIVTNGRANGDDPTINWSQLIVEPARELQEAGVEVFVVGVTAHVAQDELRIMATDPSTQHVFQVPTFDRLQTVIDPIATRICHGWVPVINALADGVQLTLGGNLLQPGPGLLPGPTGPYGCRLKYAKIGCYSDDGNNPRPLPEELFTDQSPTSPMFTGQHVDYENWDQYLPKIVCRCAEITNQKGYKIFGLQMFGSCWSGPQAGQTYAIDGEADQDMCVSFGFKMCTPTDQVCVGKQQTNFVYTFDDEERR